jgi:hypothetical protein
MTMCDAGLFVTATYTKVRPNKAAAKLAQFPLEQIVRLVLAINDENVPNTFVVAAAREIANRAASTDAPSPYPPH